MAKKKIKSSEIKELDEHPLLKGIPDNLKEVSAFEKVEGDIRRIMISDHKHRKMETFAKCKRCQAKVAKRREYIKNAGFKDYHQYLLWRKVMEIIKNAKDFELV